MFYFDPMHMIFISLGLYFCFFYFRDGNLSSRLIAKAINKKAQPLSQLKDCTTRVLLLYFPPLIPTTGILPLNLSEEYNNSMKMKLSGFLYGLRGLGRSSATTGDMKSRSRVSGLAPGQAATIYRVLEHIIYCLPAPNLLCLASHSAVDC